MINVKEHQINYFDLAGKNLSFAELGAISRKSVFEEGYIILRNFPIALENLKETKSQFLELSSLVGKPISHDANDSIIWDIKANPASSSFIKTYSEHSHKSALHTYRQPIQFIS